MIRAPFTLSKMTCDAKTDMIIYRSRLHATLKRNFQLMPALKWLRLLLNHVPDNYEHLVRYYGYYSDRARGERRQAQHHDTALVHAGAGQIHRGLKTPPCPFSLTPCRKAPESALPGSLGLTMTWHSKNAESQQHHPGFEPFAEPISTTVPLRHPKPAK